MPKRFQLDLSNPGRRRNNNEPAEEPSSGVDLIVGKGQPVAEENNSFRSRLAQKFAEDDQREKDNLEKGFLPKIFKKPKKSEKLDLRAGGLVPPPVEVGPEAEEVETVENYQPGVLKLKSFRSGTAEEMLASDSYERVSAPVVSAPKKKRRRRKKKPVVLPPVAAPIFAPIVASVAVPAAPAPIASAVLIAPEAGAPVLPPADLPVIQAVEPTVNTVTLPPAVLAAEPKKKKKRRKKKIAPELKPTQEVPIRIAEAPAPLRVEVEPEEKEEISFRDSLAKKINGEEAPVDKPITYTFREKTLENGLRVIFAPLSGTRTVTALMVFGTGSKYESLSQNGLSHFLEHMFFKGTKNRAHAQKISSELDALGSEYNAFTSKEYTGYWIKVDNTKTEPALDILSDMLLNSKFSPAEIDREKGVIIEEINMYHENPLMYIEDVFEKCLYGETPAGREIIGPKENIKKFKRQDFLDYFSSQYGSNSAVLVLAGAISRQTEDLVSKYFEPMIKRPFKEKLRTPDHQSSVQVKTYYQEGKQANLSLGVRTYDTYHPDKIILKVLSVILGGSMSSRLFEEVREKRGLAYYIRTQTEFFTDTGYLTTQAGVPAEKIGEAVETIIAEYQKISEKPVSKEELKRACDLIRGRTIIAFEESDAIANWYARQSVLREEVVNPEQFFAAIDRVTPLDIQRVASDIFKANKLNLAVIGPFKGGGQFEKHLKFKKVSTMPGIFSFFA